MVIGLGYFIKRKKKQILNKHFKPIFQESNRMKKLMTTDDEDSNDNISFRGCSNTYRGSDYPLASDRSSSSIYTKPKNFRHTQNSLARSPTVITKAVNQFAVSDDNPFASNILKYYRSETEKRNTKRETSLSAIERRREFEAQIKFASRTKDDFRENANYSKYQAGKHIF